MSRRRAALALFTAALSFATPSTAQEPTPERLQSGPIVYHYAPGGERLAHRIAAVTAAAPPLPALPADVFSQPVDVYLAPDERAFARLSGGSPPEWGAGLAILRDDRDWIVLPAYGTDRVNPSALPRVLRHELAHVALHRYLGDARVPRWFHEGYGRWAAGELDFEAEWQLRLAFATDRAPPLDSLSLDWPSSRLDAGVAYLLSASAIDYLVAEGGMRGLSLFLARWRESGDLEHAMLRTYGMSVSQFEEHWRKHVRGRYGWALILTQSAVFWAIAAVLLVILFWRRRRRDRLRYQRMILTDPPDEPEFWNPDFDRAGEAEIEPGTGPGLEPDRR